MSSPSADPLLHTCAQCDLVSDVAGAGPFTQVICPGCGVVMFVRTRFDHFQLLGEVGIGGMSRVFEAEDLTLGRRVALKILKREGSTDAARIEQFEREARLTASFSHPHIVKVFSVGRDQGYFYIAMELVPGGSLDDRIRRGGAQPEGEILELALELVQGLRVAHQAGLIHRDIKPGNILFSRDGKGKIVDFGLALIQGKEKDDTGEIWATPYYVPTEKLDGHPDTFRGDMYSLGATLFHALAGRPPYAKDTSSIEELRKIKSFQVHLQPLVPGTSDETCAIIDRLLARKPEHRYRSYDELHEHFEYALKKLKAGGPRKPVKATWIEKNLPAVAGATIAVVIGLVVAGILAGGGKPRKDPAGGGGNALGGPVAESDQSATAKFLQARETLLAGNPAKARTLFQAIAGAASTHQPTLNWALFNDGLCALIQGDREGASGAFNRLAAQEPWSTVPDDQALAAFFAEAAASLKDPSPASPSEAAKFPASTVRGAALLALGLKNWELGHPLEAAGFFQLFQKATPPPSVIWIEDYKKLLVPYLADLETAKSLPVLDLDAPAGTAKEAVAATEKILSQFKLPRGLKAETQSQLVAFRAALKQREDEAEVARAAALKTLATEEAGRIDSALVQARAFRGGYRFQQGADLLKALELQAPPSKERRDDQLYLWQEAEDFMKLLGEDLNTRNYSGEIERSTGPPLVGLITRASRDKWLVRAGPMEQVIEVAAEPAPFLVGLAEQFAGQTADSDQYYRRREAIVAFAKLCDLDDYARGAGEALTRESRAFRERWKRLAQAK